MRDLTPKISLKSPQNFPLNITLIRHVATHELATLKHFSGLCNKYQENLSGTFLPILTALALSILTSSQIFKSVYIKDQFPSFEMNTRKINLGHFFHYLQLTQFCL